MHLQTCSHLRPSYPYFDFTFSFQLYVFPLTYHRRTFHITTQSQADGRSTYSHSTNSSAMADPAISGLTLSTVEKSRILDLSANGQTENLRGLLQDLATTKQKTIGQLILEATDEVGLGMIHKAAEHDQTAIVKMVCEDLGLQPATKLAVLNAQEQGGRTAASIAAQLNHDAFLRELIAGGASMLIHDWMHGVPLHRAAMHSNTRAMVVLLTLAGPDQAGIDMQTASGQTPLHLALVQGDTLRAGLLIRAGANVELQTAAGSTAMHLSVPLWTESNNDREFNAMMHMHFMRIINAPGSGLNGRANLRIPDIAGKLPRDIALDMGHNKALMLLIAYDE
jgi:hypothetical protein